MSTSNEAAALTSIEKFNKRLNLPYITDIALGGKRLHIDDIYRLVTDAGGFQKVTDGKKWKTIGEHFDLPLTCTNSAFILKSFYMKHCFSYEQVKVHGVDIKDLPTYVEAVPEPEFKKNIVKSVSDTNAPVSLPVIPEMLRNSNSLVNLNQPRVDLSNLDEDGKDARYLYVANKSRVLLALQSKLPNEVDWAYNKLVKISFNCPDNFHIGAIPGLLECILETLDAFFNKLNLNLSPTDFETSINDEELNTSQILPEVILLVNPSVAALFERTLQALHVLRNFSFLEHNAKYLSETSSLITIIAKGIALPLASNYIQIKQHCIDIAENLATHIQLTGQKDFFLVCFKKMLFENDRALILASVRTLTRFCVHAENQVILQNFDSSIVSRMFDLMLISDDDIVSSIMDYLYQYTSLNKNVASKIAFATSLNVVKFLCKFLHWKGLPQPLAQPQASGTPALRGPDHKPKKKIVTTQETRTITTKTAAPPMQYGNYGQSQGFPGMPGFPGGQNFGYNAQQMIPAFPVQRPSMQMQTPGLFPPTMQAQMQTPRGLGQHQTHSPSLNAQKMLTPLPKFASHMPVKSTTPEIATVGKFSFQYSLPVVSDKNSCIDDKNDSSEAVLKKRKQESESLAASESEDEMDDEEEEEDESVEEPDDGEFVPAGFAKPKREKKVPEPKLKNPPVQNTPLPKSESSTPAPAQQISQLNMLARSGATPLLSTPFRPPPVPVPGMPMQPMMPMYPFGYQQQPQYNYMPPVQTPTTRTVVEEVKHEVTEEAVYSYPCCWTQPLQCTQVFDTEEELTAHVEADHASLPLNGRYICFWKTCSATHKFFRANVSEMDTDTSPVGLLSAQHLKTHIKTHYPLRTVVMKQVMKPYKEPTVPAKTAEQPGLSGIPLTCLLILRNLAKCAKELFVECESDLALIMAVDGRYAKFIGQILAEL